MSTQEQFSWVYGWSFIFWWYPTWLISSILLLSSKHSIHFHLLSNYDTDLTLSHFASITLLHKVLRPNTTHSQHELIQIGLTYSININVISQWDRRLYSARGVKFVVNFFLAFGSIEINPISRGTLKHSLPWYSVHFKWNFSAF